MKRNKALVLYFLKDLTNRKIFYVAIGIGLFFTLLSLLLGPLSYKESSRLAINFSLSGIQIALIFLSILIGADFIKKDIEEQTLHMVLVRPVSRTEYYLAKVIAYAIGLIISCVVMWGFFFVISQIVGLKLTAKSLIPFLGIMIESLILFNFAMLFSMFSAPLLAILCSFSLFLAGHWIEVLRFLAEKTEGFTKIFGFILSWTIPNLESLNWKSNLTYNDWLSAQLYLKFSSYGLCWVLVLLVLGILVFSRKDLA